MLIYFIFGVVRPDSPCFPKVNGGELPGIEESVAKRLGKSVFLFVVNGKMFGLLF